MLQANFIIGRIFDSIAELTLSYETIHAASR